ncbi:hypothetical protein [Pararhizobium sp.]|uniref:hypothetical protein n=1 Tax=Pararhizobium sp. TaxID=1977563 RepID=UPI002722DB2A|nr:hypothetical protein [Pararhizobium sp.]MDO9417004.1 hypothetical protein [Pararhizobium sp.]
MTAAGHNSKLTEQEHQALWGHHVRRRVAARRKADAIKAEEVVLKKEAKNDGISEQEMKDFLDCMLSDDKQKKVDNFHMLKRNRIRLGLIADDRKGDLLADRVTNQDMIFASGVESGLAALDRASKFAAGSDEERAFLDGYDEGQRIARDNLQSAMEKRNAATSKEEPASDGDPFPDSDADWVKSDPARQAAE